MAARELPLGLNKLDGVTEKVAAAKSEQDKLPNKWILLPAENQINGLEF